MSNIYENKNNQKTISKCAFCNGTGITECIDFNKMNNLPNGVYSLDNLIKERGEHIECPEGCEKLN